MPRTSGRFGAMPQVTDDFHKVSTGDQKLGPLSTPGFAHSVAPEPQAVPAPGAKTTRPPARNSLGRATVHLSARSRIKSPTRGNLNDTRNSAAPNRPQDRRS